MIAFLRENKFKVSGFERVYRSIDATDCRPGGGWSGPRTSLDFLIDGMVIKIDDFAAREAGGLYAEVSPLGRGL